MKLVTLLFAFLAMLGGAAAFQSPSPKRSIKGSALQMTVLSYNGKKKDFKAGSPLKSAVAGLGVKPKYSCKQ
jgi:hypothetical protein